jgi:hypothetical protein
VPSTPVTAGVNDGGGSAVAIDFSRDREQRLMFVINRNSSRIEIMERGSGKVLGNFDRPGPYPREFNQAHGLAITRRAASTSTRTAAGALRSSSWLGGG